MRDRLVALAMVLGVVVGAVLTGVLAIDGMGEDDEPAPLPVLYSAQTAGAAADTDATAAEMSLAQPGGVEIEVVGDLPALEGEAAAWRVDRSLDTDRVRSIAGALGIDGDVEETESGWAVDDGAARLDVQAQPGLPWWYGPSPDTAVTNDAGAVGGGSSGSSGLSSGVAVAEPTEPAKPDCPVEESCQPPPGCEVDGTCLVDPPVTDPGDTVVCSDPVCPPDGDCFDPCAEPEPPADKPSQDQARATAAPVFDAAGVDLDSAAVRLDDTFTGWAVTADPVVGGLPTVGMSTSVTVGPDGIEYAGGWLSGVTEGDTYPLIGTTAALQRFEEQGAGGPMPLTATEPATDIMICQDDGSGGCLPPEPIVLRVTGARLGLQLLPSYDTDEGWLVPSYLFEVDGGGPATEIPVIAVADEYLTEPPAPDPAEPPPGCELVGGDAVACPEPGVEEPSPGVTEPDLAPAEPAEAEVAPLPDGARAEIGVGYYVDISTHCGVREVEFDGRWWDADPVLDATGWAQPTEGGTITLLAPEEAEFVGDAARTKVARFVARPDGAPAPEPCR